MRARNDRTTEDAKARVLTLLTRRQALGLAVVAGAGSLFLAACGGSATATSAPAVAATTAPVPTVAATSAVQSTATGATGARATATTSVKKVSAHTASVAEITAAFQAAGIPSADRWAREGEGYRPYPTDNPTFAKLRSNLVKYNPAPDVVEKIIATLSLS